MALTDLQARSDHLILPGALLALKGGYYRATLTGDVVIDQTYPSVIGLDPGGAHRDVTLEGIATAAGDPANHGKFRLIHNRADNAENLVVKSAETSPTTIATINQNEAGLFYHDEDTGWALVFAFTVALT
jgi:hypothetical protein